MGSGGHGFISEGPGVVIGAAWADVGCHSYILHGRTQALLILSSRRTIPCSTRALRAIDTCLIWHSQGVGWVRCSSKPRRLSQKHMIMPLKLIPVYLRERATAWKLQICRPHGCEWAFWAPGRRRRQHELLQEPARFVAGPPDLWRVFSGSNSLLRLGTAPRRKSLLVLYVEDLVLGAGLCDLHLHRDLLGVKMTLPACSGFGSTPRTSCYVVTNAGTSEAVLEHSSWVVCSIFIDATLCRCPLRSRCTIRRCEMRRRSA